MGHLLLVKRYGNPAVLNRVRVGARDPRGTPPPRESNHRPGYRTAGRGSGDSPVRVAERFDIDLAAVYEALAYYHGNPEEMRRVEEHRAGLADKAEEITTVRPPGEL